jgi:hypothetical protein
MKMITHVETAFVERTGYRLRQPLGAIGPRGETLVACEPGYGALELFAEAVIDPGARVAVDAPIGSEAVVYLLDGECVVEDEPGWEAALTPDHAALLVPGQGAAYLLRNPSSRAAAHALVAAFAGPSAHLAPRREVAAFGPRARGLVWIAAPRDPKDPAAPLHLESDARLGIATLDPGVEVVLGPAWNRGLYVDVLEGQIELGSAIGAGSAFVEAGSDVRASLESAVRIQGVTSARVAVCDVPLEFVQDIT